MQSLAVPIYLCTFACPLYEQLGGAKAKSPKIYIKISLQQKSEEESKRKAEQSRTKAEQNTTERMLDLVCHSTNVLFAPVDLLRTRTCNAPAPLSFTTECVPFAHTDPTLQGRECPFVLIIEKSILRYSVLHLYDMWTSIYSAFHHTNSDRRHRSPVPSPQSIRANNPPQTSKIQQI